MAKADLARDVHSRHLDYDQLLSALDLIEGECVIVRLSARTSASEAGLVSIVGQLHHQRPGRYSEQEFAVGNPYPDLNFEHPVGGLFFISQQAFESATLSTYDGNDHFAIGVTTRSVDILVQDRDSTYP
jgi:hypothetical protein